MEIYTNIIIVQILIIILDLNYFINPINTGNGFKIANRISESICFQIIIIFIMQRNSNRLTKKSPIN